ncbi:MAG: flavodoxin family protein [Candidatus Omnitrophica bacterium]|nr:flavodoxin family protein [Candidatus Omnitrophota bacterium]
MNVVAFNGSPRKDGNTAYLLNKVLEPIRAAGIATEIVQVGGTNVRGCRACYTCKELQNKRCIIDTDIVNTCLEKMIAADAIILGSPTYFADVASEMKALIDRAGFVSHTNGGLFKRKVGAAVVAVRRGGATNVLDSINKLFLISEMIVPGSTYWNFGIGLEKEAVSKDEEGLQNMANLGETIAWLMKKIKEA